MRPFEDNRLLAFLKEPIPGKVKTRLAKALGEKKACEAYRSFLENLAPSYTGKHWKLELHFCDEDGNAPVLQRIFGPNASYFRQVESDLGRRMLAGLHSAFERGASSCLVVGGDSPELMAQDLEDAFQKLKHADIVLGPTPDGGYWSIGMNRVHSTLFTGISWSTENVFENTLKNAEKYGLKVDVLRRVTDIDELPDYEKWLKRKEARP